MSNIQKVMLSCSALCYVLVIYGFFHSASWLILLFFLLHSLCLLYFCYLTYTSGKVPEVEEELNSLKDSFESLTAENSRLTQELENASAKCAELSADLDAALEQQKIMEAQVPDQPDPTEQEPDQSSLLPPLSSAGTSAEAINIIQVARDTAQEFSPFAKEADIDIQIQLAGESDTFLIKADLNRIRVLFRNIIDNSIKYMKRCGKLVITISTVGDDLFIVLKDNGEGLSDAETPHIFEMNYQGSNRISGNGLGLTQAKAIVDFYGGTIYARSTAGKGMGIYIQIPMNECI